MMKLEIVLSAVVISASVGIRSFAQGAKSPMITKIEFFDRIDSLAKLKNLTSETIAKALKLPLQFQEVSRSENTTISEAQPTMGGWARRVELREAVGNSKGAIVEIEVSPDLIVSTNDVTAHFGKKMRAATKSPHAPADSPDYYVFSLKGQDLSFGFSPDAAGSVVRVVLKRR